MGSKKKIKIKRPKDESKRFDLSDSNSTPSPEELPPVFSFEHIQSPYSHEECQPQELAALVKKLCQLSKIPWGQIKQVHRHGCGCEQIQRSSIKGVSIPKFITPDITLLAFRFYGKAPMIGFRSERIFHIVWLDRDFTVYKH